MIKTVLILEDDTEISSGQNKTNAIQYVATTESCNDGENLTIGSVCSKRISIDIITPENKLAIQAGEKITVYEEENGIRQKKGHYIAEKPQKKGANTTRIIAYDNISLLDKDITEWFNGLDEFPYNAYNLAKMTFEKCGINLSNASVANGDFEIKKVEFSNVTGRQIIRWLGEIFGCFCITDNEGNALYTWYKKNDIAISSKNSGDSYRYLSGGLSYEEYSIKPISRVQIRKESNDVGVSYPVNTEGGNTYVIQSNPFIETGEYSAILDVAQSLYNKLKDITYTPASVSVLSSLKFNVGDIIDITDKNGKSIVIYAMQKTRNGQTEKIECTGDYEREGATSLYSTNYKTNYGKSYNIEKSINGLKAVAQDAAGKISEIEQKAGQVSVIVSDESGELSSIINPDEISISRTDPDGNIISGFFYDTVDGEFKFYGSGEFRSAGDDGAYIRVNNDEIVLYSKNGSAKTKLGFVSDEEDDYPYLLLGNENFNGYVGLIKRFANGVWFGNSVPKNQTGNFQTSNGASGLFINTEENKAYIVAGNEMQNLYTGEAVARFA